MSLDFQIVNKEKKNSATIANHPEMSFMMTTTSQNITFSITGSTVIPRTGVRAALAHLVATAEVRNDVFWKNRDIPAPNGCKIMHVKRDRNAYHNEYFCINLDGTRPLYDDRSTLKIAIYFC
jgi:hypothetical protein